MLLDASADAALAAEGYVVLDLLGPDQVDELRAAWELIDGSAPADWDPTGLATTVRHEGTDVEAHDAISPVVTAPLRQILDDRAPFMSAFIAKKAGSAALPPHIDWSLVDEPRELTYGCWVALEEITEPNGVLGVVPGSHLLVDFERTPSDPGHDWVTELVASGVECRQIPTRAGQAVIYDHRLIHFSTPNTSDRVRLAINVGLSATGQVDVVRDRLLAFMREGAAHQIDPLAARQPLGGEVAEATADPIEPKDPPAALAEPPAASLAAAPAPSAAVPDRAGWLRRLLRRR